MFDAFIVGSARRPTTLHMRRRNARLRRAAAAVCAGAAVFALLHLLTSLLLPQRIVVAARDIPRGAALAASDLRLTRSAPAPGVMRALGAAGSAVGRMTLAPLRKNQPIFPTTLTDAPKTPAGHTVVQVRLASSRQRLAVGDAVTLVTSGGCDAASRTSNGVCVLSARAVVVLAPESAESDSPLNGGKTIAADAGGVAMAMPSQDALRVLARQGASETSPILAVTATGPPTPTPTSSPNASP